MSEEWVKALQSAGLNTGIAQTSSSETIAGLSEDCVQLVDLSSLSIIDVTGNDAAAFLQSQFCNDMKQVSTTRAQINGYCTPKGRLLALPTVVGTDAGFRLLVPLELTEGFLKRLRMYVLNADVSFIERGDWVCTGVIADSTGDLGQMGPLLGGLPRAAMDASTTETRQVVRWHDDHTVQGIPRYLLMASATDQAALWSAANDAQLRPFAAWRLADISAGIPSIRSGVIESFVPQMLNLQLIDGLSFTKGCYPGQEIVARMQYLGKLKRHMRLLHLPLSNNQDIPAPVAGDTLASGEDKAAGEVVDAIRLENHYIALLAVVKVSANTSPLTLLDQPLAAIDLPYELPSMAEGQASAG